MPKPSRGTVLITGGGRRVGAALALCLADAGYRIVIHAGASVQEAETLAAGIDAAGGEAAAIGADLRDRDAVAMLMARAESAMGPITALINNASSYRYDRAGTLEPAIWDENLRTNLEAPLFLAQSFAASRGDRAGAIVNMLDFKVTNLNPDYFSYTVAKIGMAGATRLLAMEFGGRIRVNGIAPGLTLPSGGQSEEAFERTWRMTPLRRGPTTEELGQAARFLIETRSVNGQIISLDGGASLRPRKRDISVDPAAMNAQN